MRVLIADDDADVREVLVESFRDAGFDVLQAANGLEALLCVKRDRPDAVVLDLMMPRLGGVAALAGPSRAPAPQPAAPSPPTPATIGGAPPTGRVLVVDDNPEVRAMLED